jgi:hypothetical protein
MSFGGAKSALRSGVVIVTGYGGDDTGSVLALRVCICLQVRVAGCWLAVTRALWDIMLASTPACLLYHVSSVCVITMRHSDMARDTQNTADLTQPVARSPLFLRPAPCRSFENSIAACAAPVVGLLAERVFGFTGVLNEDSLKDSTVRAHNAAALGSSLLACMTVPWSLCLLAYSALHWFYPRDKARAKAWGAGGSQGAGAAYHH